MRNLKFMNALKEEMIKNNYKISINKKDYSEEDYDYIDGCIKTETGEFLSDSHLCYVKEDVYNTIIFIQDVFDSEIKFKIFCGERVSDEDWMYGSLNKCDVICSGKYVLYKGAASADFKIETGYLYADTLTELNQLSKDLYDIFNMFDNIHDKYKGEAHE
tara:strand:- start:1182 stop:1661 length:480 start_codon:yes stop_codon:yes gene_type:complete